MKSMKIIVFWIALAGFAWAAQESVILKAMQTELDRSIQNLAMEGQAKPYFISYRVVDQASLTVEASLGTVTKSDESRYRSLLVDLRVGSYELDNSGVKKPRWGYDEEAWKYQNIRLPLDDDIAAIRHQLWLATDYNYKKALEDYTKKSKDIALKPEDEDKIPDFSRETAVVYIADESRVSVDKLRWEERLKRLSALFARYEDITISRVRFDAQANTVYFVSSEGSKIQDPNLSYSLEIEASTRSKDGMPLSDFQRFTSFNGTWDEPQIEKAITAMAEGLVALRDAEACESYAGPVLIAAPASGAFVQAVLAPLLKADKNIREKTEGLQNKVGQRVILPSISVYDDPTINAYKGQTLAGFYRFDEQGIAAQRVNLITNGVLQSFLTSRSPVKGFEKSNGHARSGGVAIGNLIMESSAPQSFMELKQRLIAECTRQGKPYGLLVTRARLPEEREGRRVIYSFDGEEGAGPVLGAFRPVQVYKVYRDGNEVLVRGVEVLSSSPLASLAKIVAVGSDPKAWSVDFGRSSVVAPSLLLSELEVRKTSKGTQTLPLLPPPEE